MALEYLNRCRFSRSVGSQQGEDLACLDGDVDTVDRDHFVVALDEVVNFNDRHRWILAHCCPQRPGRHLKHIRNNAFLNP